MSLEMEIAALLESEPFDIVQAFVLLGRLGGSRHNVEEVRLRLEGMGAELKTRIEDAQGSKDRLKALNRYLFQDLGFRGNEEDYYDPRNSFLGDVLERKTGLPITLSLVYVEVGQLAGLPLAGVGFPGHFLVRYEEEGDPIFVDPFHDGRILAEEDLRNLLIQTYGESVDLTPTLLQAATAREIFSRMLYNLKGIYMTSEDFGKLLQVMDLLLLLDPRSSLDLRDRGLLYYELGDFPKARTDLTAYLQLDPTAGDAEVIRTHLNDIESRLSMFG